MKFSHMNTLAWVTGTKPFSLSHHNGQNGIIFVCISSKKYARYLHESVKLQKSTFLFLQFHTEQPGCFPMWKDTKIRPGNRASPDTNEEALKALLCVYVVLTEQSTKTLLVVTCLCYYHGSLKMTTRCLLRTPLMLMVLLHLSMCHSAMSWLRKKQRKDSSNNKTLKPLKGMLNSLIWLSGDSQTCNSYKLFIKELLSLSVFQLSSLL